MSFFCMRPVPTKLVDIDVSKAYLNVPSDWGLLEPATAYVEFALPKGTLKDLSLKLGEFIIHEYLSI